MYSFVFADPATEALGTLKHSPNYAKQYKAVQEALKFLQHNPRHPSLETHKYAGLKGPQGQDVFEAYAQQQTSRAYRIFFCYAKTRHVIEILAVVPHPD